MKSGRLRNQRGVAIVETAITLIPFFVFLFGVLEAGWLFYVQATITHAAREGAKIAVRPLQGGSDTLMTEDQVRTYVAPFLTPIGVNCPTCITLTSSTVNACPSCSSPRNSLMAHVSIRIPYTLLTLSLFGINGFTMGGDGFMRKETSSW
jgi:Flp pilus assembly protein TadG